jgi:hypothetical protein
MQLPWSGSGTLDLRQLGEGLFRRLADSRQCHAGLFEQGRGHPALLIEQGQKHMLDVDTLMISPLSIGRRRLQSFLNFDCHPIHIHGSALQLCDE